MLETYAALLTETSRNLRRNARESPVLYFWFGCMLVFSLLMLAVLTVFILNNEVEVQLDDVVLSLCFLFMFKSSADMHRYFSTSAALSYPFSTQVSHRKTVFEVVLVVFWVNLGIFVLFSSLYMGFLSGFGVSLMYPWEYLQIVLAVVFGIVIGVVSALHVFSSHRIRIIPALLLLAGFWFFREIPSLLILLLCTGVYLFFSLGFVMDSYQFVARKKRQKEQLQLGVHTMRKAVFYKETITLWREKLLPSFVFTAALMGGFAGYLTVFGDDLFIPEHLQEFSQPFLHSAYGVIGIYIVVIYLAVFPMISMFLNEEKTLWILRHLPVKEKTIIEGKVCALALPLIASIPFLAYYAAFTGTQYLLFSCWFLMFSYLIGIIVSLPIGVKYLGKKSDILVLYSVALVVFVLIAIGFGVEQIFSGSLETLLMFYVVSILVELAILYVAILLSSSLLTLKYRRVLQKTDASGLT